ECYVWEAYDAGANIIHSRETRRWVRELIGTIVLECFSNTEELGDEIICKVFQAVVGTSRLPLTSVESPMPQFSLGQLAYFRRLGDACPEAMRSYSDLVDRGSTDDLAPVERAKLLETLLHVIPSEDMPHAVDLLCDRWPAFGQDFVPLFQLLFNEA